ncbi:MAG: DinB family protein [Algoriphagus sp.]|uniref:DinB family protein n=1 Tax=Algoriphagus sp. TaxID=1872435 RepID=UPI0018599F88|nr:DinB family protein [Algoriphagus sp.]NVJ85028.1 DinB family protein [Algoriphagus sp.]
MKEAMLEMLVQMELTSSNLQQVQDIHWNWKLNKNSNSIGFILLHMGEIVNLFGTFFEIPTDVQNTTLGFEDNGQGKDIQASLALIKEGFSNLKDLIESSEEEFWKGIIFTPFFGEVSRFRLFSHILFHHFHHSGQISAIMKKGRKFD